MAERIEKLTLEQVGRLPEFAAEWVAVGLSTAPADRARAEAGVTLAYEAAGLPPPGSVIWLGSPMAGALGAALLAQVEAQVGDQVWAQVWDQVWAQVEAQVRDQVWAQVEAQVWDQVRAQVGAQVGAQVRAQVGAQVGAQVEASLWGQHDAGWLGWADFFARAVGLSGLHVARGLQEVARSSGWWWAFRNAVVLTDRPAELSRDAEGRLHSTDGPALLYRDGWGIWAIHGVRVPQEVVESPESLDPAAILAEPDVEVRRVMIERHGVDRLMAELEPVVVDADVDRIGAPRRLLRIDLAEDEPLCMVEVQNSTPEPDGTWRNYLLRVPPGVETCEAAVAWTFGADRLQLMAET